MKASQRLIGNLPALISAALLVAAVFGRWPYGFYMLMRLVVCGCSAFLAVKANGTRNVLWTWVMAGVAVLFNPVLPLRMHRGDWQIVDTVAAITFLVFLGERKAQGDV